MVQLGGFEPPTSGSTDRRSEPAELQLHNLVHGRIEPRSQPLVWQARVAPPNSLVAPPCLSVQIQKSPGGKPGLSVMAVTQSRDGQATLEKALLTLSLIGSAVSVAIFWARAARSLVCAVTISNCLRACAVE